MTYKIEWTLVAAKDMKRIPKQDQSRIYNAVSTLEDSNQWKNVKRLIEHQYAYRLRVGNYRVFFDTKTEIKVLKVQEVKRRDSQTY